MDANETNQDISRILTQFKSESGELTGTPFDLPINVNVKQLQLICNALLQQEEQLPYSFYVNDVEIATTLSDAVKNENLETEKVLQIVYQPQAVFKVRPVTRCTSSLPGHAAVVLSALFSPDGRYLASGSGDCTVRFWDVNTETPHFVCKGHKDWVLSIAWSPDGLKLASGCKNGQICIWDPSTGKQIGKTLIGHRGRENWITYLSWEPIHRDVRCRRLASSSKDCTVRIWDYILGYTLFTLATHTQSITCVKWGGSGLIYTASQDRTINVWSDEDGKLCRTLKGHAHWVNTLALNTDYVMRTGAFDPKDADVVYRDINESDEILLKQARERYNSVRQILGMEILISGSDDFTMHLWHPEDSKHPVARMTGHQQPINDVKFSPDTRLVASASFDKSIRLWESKSGRFIATLRGHVQAVYQISWSADSRMFVSGSADSSLKVWDISTKKLSIDLPGHADQVYAVDWSPDGQRVVSGGKDKVLKIWRK